MINVTEIAANAEERVLTGVKVSQALVLDGLKNAAALADRVVPARVGDRIEERTEGLPAAAPLVDSYFGFAGKLLDAQREFVGEVVEIFQPTPAPAPKKTTAKKSTAKKTTAKKSTSKAA